MKISQKGLDLIKKYEGCRLKAYKPVAAEKYWTIGWGHYGPGVKEGMTITQEEANRLLEIDIVAFENEVNRVCDYLALNQNQFDALVSFTYNCGAENLMRLTANKTRSVTEIAQHIEAYNKGANGTVLAGLKRRRAEERQLYETPCIDNSAKLKFLGITKFHEAGYKGKGITIVSREGASSHGTKVLDVLKQVAPEANILYKLDYAEEPLVNVDIYTTSYFQSKDTYDKSIENSKKMAENNVFLCCAVGNDDEEKQTPLSKQNWWTSVGACNLVNGKPLRMYYSSVTEDLDFMSFTNFGTATGTFTGTSCAAPVFAAMVALVQCFFVKKTGRKLTNEELLNFISYNCIDLIEEGKDDYTGYGLFVLPDPDTIEINKYIEEEEDMVRYETIEEIPSWGKEAVQKAIDLGILKGTGQGLGLTETELKVLVWMYRAKVFDF